MELSCLLHFDHSSDESGQCGACKWWGEEKDHLTLRVFFGLELLKLDWGSLLVSKNQANSAGLVCSIPRDECLWAWKAGFVPSHLPLGHTLGNYELSCFFWAKRTSLITRVGQCYFHYEFLKIFCFIMSRQLKLETLSTWKVYGWDITYILLFIITIIHIKGGKWHNFWKLQLGENTSSTQGFVFTFLNMKQAFASLKIILNLKDLVVPRSPDSS